MDPDIVKTLLSLIFRRRRAEMHDDLHAEVQGQAGTNVLLPVPRLELLRKIRPVMTSSCKMLKTTSEKTVIPSMRIRKAEKIRKIPNVTYHLETVTNAQPPTHWFSLPFLTAPPQGWSIALIGHRLLFGQRLADWHYTYSSRPIS